MKTERVANSSKTPPATIPQIQAMAESGSLAAAGSSFAQRQTRSIGFINTRRISQKNGIEAKIPAMGSEE